MSLPASWETQKPVHSVCSYQAVIENHSADREVGLKGDSAQHIPVPSRNRHRAGQAGSSQPEPHVRLSCIGSRVPVYVANPPVPTRAEEASGYVPQGPEDPLNKKSSRQAAECFPLHPGGVASGPDPPWSARDTAPALPQAARPPDSAGEPMASGTAGVTTCSCVTNTLAARSTPSSWSLRSPMKGPRAPWGKADWGRERRR